ncbi:potassium channel family protein [Engelhardtia mirabilis]|uniref:Ktr system potassium uptake protein A n=1 Tax=Engelhardtia mirabilis TaxID=2528011 RepID=A0A518BQJ3_9BACT|nr:Ktr system potassium uptake protein A [Planctomycetes bacterium Pla133]QDV03575.1 Ktr system potassium uptake protein A [Planctomycetes bacterium Pla86]
MKQQVLVVGLGQFGMAAARALSAGGVKVLAVDVDDNLVRLASTFAAEAVRLDATDEEALATTSPAQRNVCLCAIGHEAREASIICTALLRQMGAKRVIARANDDVHARILTLVGASVVVNPEREYGERFANRIVYQDIRGEMALGEGLIVTEIDLPDDFAGQTLGELRLPVRFGVTVVAIRRSGSGQITSPGPESQLEQGDILVVVAKPGAVPRMIEGS